MSSKRAKQATPLAVAPTPSRWEFLERTGPWFWTLVALGVVLRVCLAVASTGTRDVELWTEHASGVAREGLVLHYVSAAEFNHPPPVSVVMSWLWQLSQSSGIAFSTLYRVPIALADGGAAALLWFALRGERRRAVCVALYCVAPVALVLAGQHGNTDALIGCCLLGCVLLASSGRAVLAGVLLGVSAWIKLPGLLAAPAIGFALPRWRDRCVCGAVALAVAACGFLPTYLEAQRYAAEHAASAQPAVNALVERVFGYQGQYIHTVGNPPTFIWGLKNFFLSAWGHPDRWPELALWWIDLRQRPIVDHSPVVALTLMFVFAFLRRRERSAVELGATIALTYAIFYGLIEAWTFQYFGWSMALWMLASPRFALAANLLGGGFIYGLYAFVCGDWLLRTRWDFVGHPYWPEWLLLLRDAALLCFVLFGLAAFVRALWREVAFWRTRSAARPAA